MDWLSNWLLNLRIKSVIRDLKTFTDSADEITRAKVLIGAHLMAENIKQDFPDFIRIIDDPFSLPKLRQAEIYQKLEDIRNSNRQRFLTLRKRSILENREIPRFIFERVDETIKSTELLMVTVAAPIARGDLRTIVKEIWRTLFSKRNDINYAISHLHSLENELGDVMLNLPDQKIIKMCERLPKWVNLQR